jgi:hypothetical protein
MKNRAFLIRNSLFLVRNRAFLGRNGIFPFRNRAFLGRKIPSLAMLLFIVSKRGILW